MKYSHLLFDLDGTLFDYDKAESEALKNSFLQLDLPYDSAFLQIYRALNLQIWQEFEKGNISQKELKTKRFANLSDSLKIEFDPQKFSDKYLLNLSKRTSLIEGCEDLLSQLNGNTDLYLITNGLTIVQNPRIRNSSIGHYFKGVIISEEVGFAKPHKEIFDIAFENMNNPDKDKVLIIGDSLSSDIAGGINYGIDTCWYNPKDNELDQDFKPTYQIKELKEIFTLIQN